MIENSIKTDHQQLQITIRPDYSYKYTCHQSRYENAARYCVLGFPGSTVIKNPTANAEDTGSSPGPGRSHMPWSS